MKIFSRRANGWHNFATGLALCTVLAAPPAWAQTTFTGVSMPSGSTCTAVSVYGTDLQAVTTIKFGQLSARKWLLVSANEIQVYPPEVKFSMTATVRLLTAKGFLLTGPEFTTTVAAGHCGHHE